MNKARQSINEFFTCSTIHGFQFIPRAKRLPVKVRCVCPHVTSSPLPERQRHLAVQVFWLSVVLAGFSASAVIINNSYMAWRESPVATSISTHPINKLDFPKVHITVLIHLKKIVLQFNKIYYK